MLKRQNQPLLSDQPEQNKCSDRSAKLHKDIPSQRFLPLKRNLSGMYGDKRVAVFVRGWKLYVNVSAIRGPEGLFFSNR